MSMEENLRKRKNKDVEEEGVKRQDIEITEFVKYSKSVSELRQHILSYCSDPTLFNYSQCSNLCNSEIQIFNTTPPVSINITEESDGVMVQLVYEKQIETIRDYRTFHRCVDKKFKLSENKEMLDHLMAYYKYVKQSNTVHIRANVKIWPMGLMKLEQIKNIDYFEITIYKSMCNDFIEDIRSNDLSGKLLRLFDCGEESDRATIPAHFFKSVAFQTLENVNLYLKAEIDSEDFINMKNNDVDLTASISYDAIRERVNKWNNETHEKECSVNIKLPDEDNRILDVFDIFPKEQYDLHIVSNFGNEDWKIGKVNVCVRSKSMYLNFNTD